MNEQQAFERIVADSVSGIGPLAPSAGAIERAVSRASGRRQRPRWLALVKEPPMRRASGLAVGSPTVRVAGIMVATILVALVLAAAAAGSRLLADDAEMTLGNGPIIVEGTAFDPYTGEIGPDPCDCTFDASWSADGQRVAFRRASRILVADLAEGREWYLAHSSSWNEVDDHLSMAADGGSVAFTDEGDVWLVDVETRTRTRITDLGEGRRARAPTLDPGGERVAFLIDGEPGIWVADLAGGEPWQLTTDAGAFAPLEPAWSPDGRTIAYLTDPPAAELISLRLWLVDVASGEQRPIWESPGCCSSIWGGPAWSPDGLELAVVATDMTPYTEFPTRSWSLWVVAADGSTARQLGPAGSSRPAWQPVPLAEAATPPADHVAQDSPMPT